MDITTDSTAVDYLMIHLLNRYCCSAFVLFTAKKFAVMRRKSNPYQQLPRLWSYVIVSDGELRDQRPVTTLHIIYSYCCSAFVLFTAKVFAEIRRKSNPYQQQPRLWSYVIVSDGELRDQRPVTTLHIIYSYCCSAFVLFTAKEFTEIRRKSNPYQQQPRLWSYVIVSDGELRDQRPVTTLHIIYSYCCSAFVLFTAKEFAEMRGKSNSYQQQPRLWSYVIVSDGELRDQRPVTTLHIIYSYCCSAFVLFTAKKFAEMRRKSNPYQQLPRLWSYVIVSDGELRDQRPVTTLHIIYSYCCSAFVLFTAKEFAEIRRKSNPYQQQPRLWSYVIVSDGELRDQRPVTTLHIIYSYCCSAFVLFTAKEFTEIRRKSNPYQQQPRLWSYVIVSDGELRDQRPVTTLHIIYSYCCSAFVLFTAKEFAEMRGKSNSYQQQPRLWSYVIVSDGELRDQRPVTTLHIIYSYCCSAFVLFTAKEFAEMRRKSNPYHSSRGYGVTYCCSAFVLFTAKEFAEMRRKINSYQQQPRLWSYVIVSDGELRDQRPVTTLHIIYSYCCSAFVLFTAKEFAEMRRKSNPYHQQPRLWSYVIVSDGELRGHRPVTTLHIIYSACALGVHNTSQNKGTQLLASIAEWETKLSTITRTRLRARAPLGN
ncbi:hypothetical protein J6590_067621 [Homalodisca vitripennis]|nr:hypothetical protein J6590_067621 [Homalodisca vitripennis]